MKHFLSRRMSLIFCFKTLNMDWEFLFLNKYLGEAPFWRQDRFHKFNPFWQLQRWHCETSTNQLPTKFNNNNTNLLFSMQIKPNKCLIACYHIFYTHNAFITLHTHIIAFMHITFCYIPFFYYFKYFEKEQKKKYLEGVYGNTDQSRIFKNLQGFSQKYLIQIYHFLSNSISWQMNTFPQKYLNLLYYFVCLEISWWFVAAFGSKLCLYRRYNTLGILTTTSTLHTFT